MGSSRIGTLPLDPGQEAGIPFMLYALAMIAGARYVPPFTRSAQIVRAILLASATATTLYGRRAISEMIHEGSFTPLRACFRIDVAPTISNVRNCLFPCFDIRPSRSLPPLELSLRSDADPGGEIAARSECSGS